MRPVLVVGDAPNLPTGLSRIARDITWHLHQDAEQLGIRVAQLGLGYDGRLFPWPVFPLYDHENWGAADIAKAWGWWAGEEPGVVITVWDPARCFPIASLPRPESVKLWGYFAIDAANRDGKLGGPAREAMSHYDRLLAYAEFGQGVIERSLELEKGDPRLAWLPHGFFPGSFQPLKMDAVAEALLEIGVPASMLCRSWLGCVASNQPRKDLAIFFQAAELLTKNYGNRRAIEDLTLWLHVDKQILTWSVPELAAIYGFDEPDKLLVTDGDLPDSLLAALYTKCHMTLAPGLGEGFCYPIVESLACGVPPAHVDYAGGREFCPPEWLFKAEGWRVEGPYAVERPVLSPWTVAAALSRAYEFAKQGERAEAFCRGSVAHLAWPSLWREWRRVLQGWLEEDFKE